MKKYIVALSFLWIISCDKVEEKIYQSVDSAAETAKQKAQKKVKETIDKTINETVNTVTNAEDVTFGDVFPDSDDAIVTEFSGKKMKFPNGSPAYLLKYKADKNALIHLMENQSTVDESKSDKTARKIDGQKFIDQLSFFEKFIPKGIIDTNFLSEIKTDKSFEFYKINRYPNKSTIIVNPKNNTIYQFVEVQ